MNDIASTNISIAFRVIIMTVVTRSKQLHSRWITL